MLCICKGIDMFPYVSRSFRHRRASDVEAVSIGVLRARVPTYTLTFEIAARRGPGVQALVMTSGCIGLRCILLQFAFLLHRYCLCFIPFCSPASNSASKGKVGARRLFLVYMYPAQ